MVVRSSAFILSLVALAACGVQTTGDATPATDTDAGAPAQAFTDVVAFDQIAVYQGVKVSLVADGQPVTATTPIVPRRPALVRVGTRVAPHAKVNKLAAQLRVRTPGQHDLVLLAGSRVLTPFDDADLATSFGWELTADQVLPGTTLSVELRDPLGTDANVLRYPADGELAMNVGTFAPKLHVTLVPVRYDADGSKRVPTMDHATLDSYERALYRLYPVSEVELSVRTPLPWPLEVLGDGSGWDALLAAMSKTRQADDVADDMYYVGVFLPAPSQNDYCKDGCVLGVAPAIQPLVENDVSQRVALIVGYDSGRRGGTLAQELAHAMGRQHAPCGGASAVDSHYPYADGVIGTWGWDIVDKRLMAPDTYVDFMSYCNPVWVSDYTFGKIYEKMLEVDRTKRPGVGHPDREPMKSYHP